MDDNCIDCGTKLTEDDKGPYCWPCVSDARELEDSLEEG